MTHGIALPPPLSRRGLLAAAACSAAPMLVPPAWAVERPADAAARVLRVGPGAPFGSLQAAVDAAREGDVVELLPGVHRAQVALIERRLTLRGAGPGATLDAAGQHAGGKGLLVVRADVTVENLVLRGTRVPDGNGAGIRHDRGHLVVRRCRFEDNEMGLLASNEPAAQIDIEDSVFADAPRHPGLLHHLLYAGTIARLTLIGCRFENGWRGHLVKSRARENHIECNLLRDRPGGEASYELELSNGGLNRVVGNIIVQGPRSQNPTLVSIGYDADPNLAHRLLMVHNTLVHAGAGRARFLHLWAERMPKLEVAGIANNLLVGHGAWPLPAGADGGGNVRVALQALRDAAADDYRLRAGCAAAGRPVVLPETSAPLLELTTPLGTRGAVPGVSRCVGALGAAV